MEPKNSAIHPSDERLFRSKVEPEIKKGTKLNIFCSFTHITPTYVLLFTLNELKKIADSGNFNVFILMWDMNTLVNPFFKKLRSSRKVLNADLFIKEKVTELENIVHSLGFDKDKVFIYKSSDLWKRLIAYKEEDLFQNFYSVLAQMKAKDFAEHKCSHLVQDPIDMFFCNYFHKLCPEDTDRNMDFAFFGEHKYKLYSSTRDLMVKKGLMDNKKPLFLLFKKFPFLIDNYNIPNWEHSLEEIQTIITSSHMPKVDLLKAFRHLPHRGIGIKIKKDGKMVELDYTTFIKEYGGKPAEEISRVLAQSLYFYLQDHKEKYLEASGEIEEKMLNITKEDEIKEMGNVLRSDISLKIMFLADGTKTVTQMAKELNKSVATISMYLRKLKGMNLIRILPNKTLKRNIQGAKINFELGM